MKRLKHSFRLRAKHHKTSHHAGSRRKVRQALLTAAAFSLGAVGLTRAQTVSTPVTIGSTQQSIAETPEARLARWKESFDAFAAADRLHAPASGGVLFVGSSSIRMWDSLEHDFQSLPVVTKRGFGGSRLSDCSDQVARLVLPYRPSVVIVYAGDNDLAEGATPQDVLASFSRFVESVHQTLPETKIAYLSIKPSPSRASLIEQIRETNRLISVYTASAPNLDYIDVYSKMVTANGKPRAELFNPDMLHLNHDGYALWRQEVSAHLGPLSYGGGATLAAAPLGPTTSGVAGPLASP